MRVFDNEVSDCWYCHCHSRNDYDEVCCSYTETELLSHGINPDCPFSKPLTRSDIENCGLTKSFKNQWHGWDDYFSGNVSGEYGYYLYYTVHFPRGYKQTNRVEHNQFKIIMHRYYISNEEETTSIEDKLQQNESEIVYVGSINNLPEFKLVLKMLNIE